MRVRGGNTVQRHMLSVEYRENGKLVGTCSCGAWRSSVGSNENAIFVAFDFHLQIAR